MIISNYQRGLAIRMNEQSGISARDDARSSLPDSQLDDVLAFVTSTAFAVHPIDRESVMMKTDRRSFNEPTFLQQNNSSESFLQIPKVDRRIPSFIVPNGQRDLFISIVHPTLAHWYLRNRSARGPATIERDLHFTINVECVIQGDLELT